MRQSNARHAKRPGVPEAAPRYPGPFAKVTSAHLETQKRFEEWCEREKVNFKLLVVAGETMCTCGPPAYDSSLFVSVRKPSDSAELAEHHRLKHQLRPSFTLSKPYVVAPWNVLDAAYQNWRAYPDKYWQFEEDYPDSGGTYFVLSPVRRLA